MLNLCSQPIELFNYYYPTQVALVNRVPSDPLTCFKSTNLAPVQRVAEDWGEWLRHRKPRSSIIEMTERSQFLIGA